MKFIDYDYPELQKQIEYAYSRKHVMRQIREWLLEQPEIQDKITQGGQLLEKWLSSDNFHESKKARLSELNDLNLEDLTRDIIIHASIILEPELFVGFTAQVASLLGFSDKGTAIHTIAEIVIVLAELDAYDIMKPDRNASLSICSRINLPQEMKDAVDRSHYLPPMLIEPDLVKTNYESPYLTFNDCQILGKGNGHTGNICLDVINKQNSVPLTLNEEFLDNVDEQPTHELDSLDKIKLWDNFKKQSHEVYDIIRNTGNMLWLTNKVDKRGRLYANGYHVNTMGTPYKKASIDLARKELVMGVPTQS